MDDPAKGVSGFGGVFLVQPAHVRANPREERGVLLGNRPARAFRFHQICQRLTVVQAAELALDALERFERALSIRTIQRELEQVAQLLGRDAHGMRPVWKVHAAGALHVIPQLSRAGSDSGPDRARARRRSLGESEW